MHIQKLKTQNGQSYGKSYNIKQESLANAKGSARQCPMVKRNTIPAVAENGGAPW